MWDNNNKPALDYVKGRSVRQLLSLVGSNLLAYPLLLTTLMPGTASAESGEGCN